MIVHVSAEAEYDLEAIGDFIARDNPTRALRAVFGRPESLRIHTGGVF